MTTQDESLEYWKGVEREVGERILGYALGQLLTPLESIPPFAYCLFYLTDTRVFIRYIPPERKIFSLPVGTTSKKLQVETISLSRKWIQKATVQVPKRRLWNLFAPPLATIRILFDSPEGQVSDILFTVESKKNEFLRNLRPEDLS